MANKRLADSHPLTTKEDKEKAKRRKWTLTEEETLIKSMMEVFEEKWRADNGFKTGFYVAVEKELIKRLPGTTLRAHPHIDSKVKGWKEKYGIIADVTRLSGFGWNHETKSIVCDSPDVWKEYEKTHSKAKGMNGKSFPMYDDWATLFGKDRATGAFAEDAVEVDDEEDDLQFDDSLPFDDCYTPRYATGQNVNEDTIFADFLSDYGNISTPTDNVTTPSPRTAIPTANMPTPTAKVATPLFYGAPKKGKKKSKLAKEEAIHEAMTSFLSKNNDTLDKLVDAVSYDTELSKRRSNIITELLKLDISLEDCFLVNAIIAQKEERVDTFYGVPDGHKAAWVKMVLEGKIYPITK